MPNDKEKRTFRIGEDVVDVPTENADAFLKDFPDAKELSSFLVEGDTVDVPIENAQAFVEDFPEAETLFVKKKEDSDFDGPSTGSELTAAQKTAQAQAAYAYGFEAMRDIERAATFEEQPSFEVPFRPPDEKPPEQELTGLLTLGDPRKRDKMQGGIDIDFKYDQPIPERGIGKEDFDKFLEMGAEADAVIHGGEGRPEAQQVAGETYARAKEEEDKRKAEIVDRIPEFKEIIDVSRSQLDGMMESHKERFKNKNIVTWQGMPIEQRRQATENSRRLMKESRTLQNTARMLDEMESKINAYEKGKGAAEGLKFKAKHLEDIVSLGWNKVVNQYDVKSIADRYMKGENISSEEQMALSMYALKQEIDSGVETPMSYDITTGVIDMIPFMAQFALTGGLASGVEAGAARMMSVGAEKTMANLLKKGAAYALGKAAVVPLFSMTSERVVGGQTRATSAEFNEEGELQSITVGDIEESLGKSLVKAGLTTYSEIVTEGMLSKLGPVDNVTKSAVGRLKSSVGWSGIAGEFTEEMINAGASGLVEGESMRDVYSPRQIMTTLAQVAIVGGTFHFAEYAGGNRSLKNGNTQTMNESGAKLDSKLKKQIDDVIDKSETADEFGKLIEPIVDGGIKDNQWNRETLNIVNEYITSRLADKQFNETQQTVSEQEQKDIEEAEEKKPERETLVMEEEEALRTKKEPKPAEPVKAEKEAPVEEIPLKVKEEAPVEEKAVKEPEKAPLEEDHRGKIVAKPEGQSPVHKVVVGGKETHLQKTKDPEGNVVWDAVEQDKEGNWVRIKGEMKEGEPRVVLGKTKTEAVETLKQEYAKEEVQEEAVPEEGVREEVTPEEVPEGEEVVPEVEITTDEQYEDLNKQYEESINLDRKLVNENRVLRQQLKKAPPEEKAGIRKQIKENTDRVYKERFSDIRSLRSKLEAYEAKKKAAELEAMTTEDVIYSELTDDEAGSVDVTNTTHENKGEPASISEAMTMKNQAERWVNDHYDSENENTQDKIADTERLIESLEDILDERGVEWEWNDDTNSNDYKFKGEPIVKIPKRGAKKPKRKEYAPETGEMRPEGKGKKPEVREEGEPVGRVQRKPVREEEVKAEKKKEETLKKVNEKIDQEVEKSEASKEAKAKAKAKMAEGAEDLAAALGIIKKAVGEKAPDPVKAVQKIAEGFIELGVQNAKELARKVRDYMVNTLGLTGKDADEMVSKVDFDQYEETIEKKKPKKPEKKEPKKVAKEVITEEWTALKEKIKAFEAGRKAGVKEGVEVGKKVGKMEAKEAAKEKVSDLDQIKQDLTDFINKHKKDIRKAKGVDITKMLNAVRDAKTKASINRAIKTLDTVVNKVQKNEAINNIRKTLDVITEKIQSGLKKGKNILQEDLRYVNAMKDAANMKEEDLADKIDEYDRKIERMQERLQEAEELGNTEEANKLQDELWNLEIERNIFDSYSNLEAKTVESLNNLAEHAANTIEFYKTKFKDQQRQKKEEFNQTTTDVAFGIAGSEKRFNALRGVGKVLDPRSSQSIWRQLPKAYQAIQNSMPYLFKNLAFGNKPIAYLKDMMNKLREGDSIAQRLKNKYTDIYRNKYKDLFGSARKYRKELNKKDTITLTEEFTDESGLKDTQEKKITLTHGELMDIYAGWYSDANRTYLEKAGVTEDTITEIEGMLSPQMKEMADWARDEFFANEEMYNEAAEVYEHFSGGRPLDRLDGWIPIRAKSYTSTLADLIGMDNVSVHKSFTKQRRGGKYIFGGGANSIHNKIMGHIDSHAIYVGNARNIQELTSVLASNRVRRAVEGTGKNHIATAINFHLFRGAGGTATTGLKPLDYFVSKFMNYIRGRFTRAHILANYGLYPKQMVSLVTIMDPDYAPTVEVLRSLANVGLKAGRAKKIFEKSSQFKNRSMIDIEGNLESKQNRAQINPDMFGDAPGQKALGTLLTFLYNPTQVGDRHAIFVGGMPLIDAAYRTKMKELQKEGEMSQTEMEESAADHALQTFERWMNTTQQSGRWTDTSVVQTVPLTRLFTVFKNSLMSYARKVGSSYAGIAKGYKGKRLELGEANPDMSQFDLAVKSLSGVNPGDLSRILLYQAVMPVLWSTVSSLGTNLTDLGSDDEEKKKKAKKDLILDATVGWMKGLFIIGSAVEYLRAEPWMRKSGGMQIFGDITAMVEDVETIIKGIKAGDKISDKEKAKMGKAGFKTANMVSSYAVGTPYELFKRLYEAKTQEEYDETWKKILRTVGYHHKYFDKSVADNVQMNIALEKAMVADDFSVVEKAAQGIEGFNYEANKPALYKRFYYSKVDPDKTKGVEMDYLLDRGNTNEEKAEYLYRKSQRMNEVDFNETVSYLNEDITFTDGETEYSGAITDDLVDKYNEVRAREEPENYFMVDKFFLEKDRFTAKDQEDLTKLKEMDVLPGRKRTVKVSVRGKDKKLDIEDTQEWNNIAMEKYLEYVRLYTDDMNKELIAKQKALTYTTSGGEKKTVLDKQLGIAWNRAERDANSEMRKGGPVEEK